MGNVQLWGWRGDAQYLKQEWATSLSNYTITGDDAYLLVKTNGTVNTTTVKSNGLLEVKGGTANSTTVKSSGSLWAYSGTVKDVTVESNAELWLGVEGGSAVLTGKVTINSGAGVNIFSSRVIVDFDISAQKPSTTPLITNMNKISGYASANYCITVSTSQASGKYVLASQAPTGIAALDIAVFTSAGDPVNWISVGDTITRGKNSYSLAYDSGNLVFTVGSRKTGDLNGDSRADVIMSITKSGHKAYGATGAWLIQSGQTAKWGDLSTRGSAWTIFGTGATSAGKKTEDVYLKSSANAIGAWTVSDSGKVTGWKSIASFDSNTQVLGLGDFNGDGQTDLLLRNKNGAVGCYLTNGRGWNYFQSLGSEWTIAAIGDLNGDGRDDVVLKHSAGFTGSWLTQGNCTMKWADLDKLQTGYSVVGCGDFNGDGTEDVLLKKGSYYGAWLVKNGSVSSWMGLGTFAGTVEQIADFDADGKDDLRLRTTAGDLGVELVKGADKLTWKYYGSVGSEWSTSLAAL